MSLRNLDDLHVLVRVADSASFSAAARSLQLDPKTVSKQIARLEHALGTPLFERNTRNLRITDEGRTVAARVRSVLSILDEIQQVGQGDDDTLRGVIRLTAPAPFGRRHVAPAIAEFSRRHPQVGFDLRLTDRMVDLYDDGFDLAIRLDEPTDSRLVSTPLALNRRMLVASPGYVAAHGTPHRPEDLSRHQALLPAGADGAQTTWTLRQGRRERTVAMNGALGSDSGDILHTWCLAGLGISLRETWDIHDALRSGRLVPVLPDWTVPVTHISAVRARRDPVPRRLDVFIEFLTRRWREAPWNTDAAR